MTKIKSFGGWDVDPAPDPVSPRQFLARARLTRQSDGHTEELFPDFDPFSTETEATAAGHMAAIAWIAHQAGTAGRSTSALH